MSNHTVAAVMLVNGRDAMVRRAVECVRLQTYGSLRLVVLDTGQKPVALPVDCFAWQHRPELGGCTIGTLRNVANALAGDAEIIAHFDSDDWSHPRRIEEQVELLVASKPMDVECVGYNQALFWREAVHAGNVSGCARCHTTPCSCEGRPYFYTNSDPRYCLGASMCYWHRPWVEQPFADTSQGEDWQWLRGFRSRGVTSITAEPRIVCRIHAYNTSTAYAEETLRTASEWTVAPAWEAYAREAMAL